MRCLKSRILINLAVNGTHRKDKKLQFNLYFEITVTNFYRLLCRKEEKLITYNLQV